MNSQPTSSNNNQTFRNQYIAVAGQRRAEIYDNCKTLPFGPFVVHLFQPLEAAVHRARGIELLIIGIAIDPARPTWTCADILNDLFESSQLSPSAVARRVQQLSGRFVVALHREGETTVWGDACHLRQILHGSVEGSDFFASSETLVLHHFDLSLRMNEAKRRFMGSTLFRENEHAWVGTQTHDDRIQRLFPNHELVFPGGRARRRPLEWSDIPHGEKAILDYVIGALRGTVESLLLSEKSVVQAVSAGWDSRVLLAASMPFRDRISFFVFDHGDRGTSTDGDIGEALGRQFQLEFERVRPQPLRTEFLAQFEREHLFPRILPKTAAIQHHHSHPNRDRLVNINGNGTEVARCYYGLENRFHSVPMLCHLLGYKPDDPYVRQSLEEWYPSALRYSRDNSVPLIDLLYWEQRMANWGAQIPFEQDISNEEISPFNNINTLLALLRIDPLKRCAPTFTFYRDLATAMCPDIMHIPINPHVSPLWLGICARFALGRYITKFIHHEMLERRTKR